MRDQLIALEADLRARDLIEEADEVRDLVDEAEALERPASWLSRVRGRVGSLARNQWDLVRKEIEESREVYDLLRRRSRGEIEELSPVQREAVRAQLLDVFKVVPGGALAVANFVAPIPCSSWLTPALLMGLGLMPSAWKEAHVQSKLGRLVRRLRDRGYLDEAGDVQVIIDDIDARVAHRERMAAIAADRKLLALYDLNRDGVLDPGEQARLHRAMDRVVRVMRRRWPARIWYLYRDGDVSGPYNLLDIDALGDGEGTLLCQAGKKQWVPLRWVLREVGDIDRRSAES